jgi:hypothetical protein
METHLELCNVSFPEGDADALSDLGAIWALVS